MGKMAKHSSRLTVGSALGASVGSALGANVGFAVGLNVGSAVGSDVGSAVGSGERSGELAGEVETGSCGAQREPSWGHMRHNPLVGPHAAQPPRGATRGTTLSCTRHNHDDPRARLTDANPNLKF